VAKPLANSPQSSFFLLCGLVLVAAVLYWAQKVLIPVALAMLLAFILTPAVAGLQRRGLGRVPSVLAVTLLVFSLLGLTGWVIAQQIAGLVLRLPQSQGELVRKLESLRGAGDSGVAAAVRDTLAGISRQLIDQGGGGPAAADTTPGNSPDHPLYVSSAPSGWSRALEMIGPAGETLADIFLVIVATIFMLVQRESLRNRVVRLIGHGRLVTTTRAIDEGSRRISRYLLSLVYVNSSFGLLLSFGLFLLGLYADDPGQPALRTTALFWGFLAFGLRFIPYLGTWVAAGLLFLYAVATLPGWTLPLVVLAYFVVLEVTTANAVEPLVFGHNTGVSPLALLLAAAFWTWLWGPMGLLLSTPLTVVLVVLGKYVPQLDFFEVLLGDEPVLNAEVQFYQRLVAHDQDEASDLVDEFLEDHNLEALCGEVLLPAVVRARRDRDRGNLDADDFQYVCRITREILDDVSGAGAGTGDKPALLLGCPARDEGDELALHLFAAVLRPQGYPVEVLSSALLTAEVMERVARQCPALVLIAALPPGGLAQVRYLCKRIRSQCLSSRILVGRWGDRDNIEQTQKRLKASGADLVAATLAESRAQVVPLLQAAAAAAPAPEDKPEQRPEPALAHSQ
jgi:predicted PurR-regulated permease PerM